MKFRNVLYVIFMIFFSVFAYFLIDRGINTKTKVLVNYKNSSDVMYKVYLHDNDIYNKDYLNMNLQYVSDMVDYIDMEFNYNDIFSKNINGYYSYSILVTLVAYTDNINESLWEKEYILVDNIVQVLNQNDLKKVNVSDNVIIDYDEYRAELDRFMDDYNLYVSGYLNVKFIIDENIDFDGIEKTISEKKNIDVIIPLSYDTFRINIINDNNKIDNYYDFSKKESVNYLLLILGALSLAVGISFFALIIRNIIIISKKEGKYNKELKRILREYDDIIVNVNKFYSKEKYNLIYVDSFKELMDVYKKVSNPISFKEIKKNSTAIFVITDEENAWIYEMNS